MNGLNRQIDGFSLQSLREDRAEDLCLASILSQLSICDRLNRSTPLTTGWRLVFTACLSALRVFELLVRLERRVVLKLQLADIALEGSVGAIVTVMPSDVPYGGTDEITSQ
jgi:hypothetical protein